MREVTFVPKLGRWLIASACLFVLFSGILLAQEFRGAILGRVTDASGAVVPDAVVKVKNEQTNVLVETRTNQEGNYHVPYLTPGRYTVTVEARGFKRTEQPGVLVHINDRIELDIPVQVGTASQSIVVNAENPMLQTATAELGQVADRAMLEPILLTSTVMSLVNMAPGVIAGAGLGFGNTMGNAQNDIAANGGSGMQSGNDVTIDGSPALAPRQAGLAVGVPMSDAVQEFKIVTTMFDASLGRSNGGAISITTKSGTNEFHGSAFYYTQNESLNANSWTNNRNGIARAPVDTYAWGGTVGGPVRLPRYDGRNRTFFFFAYEKDLNGLNQSALAFVPTEAMRKGDFSEVASSSGAPLVIYDPLSTVVNAAGTFVSRNAFANATIPASRLNPIGQAVLGKLPLPNMNVRPRINTPNWNSAMETNQVTNNWMARVDHSLSAKHRLFARVAMPQYAGFPTNPYFPGAYSVQPNGTTSLNSDVRHHRVVNLEDTVVFSPSLVGSFRAGYTRVLHDTHFDGDNQDPADLGLPAAITAHQISPGWPIFDIGGDGAPFIGSRPRASVNDIWSFITNFTKVRGSHNLRFGSDYRVVRWNERNPGTQANGQFTFNNALTRSNPTLSSTGNTSGSAMGSLLLGLPATASGRGIGYTSPVSLQVHYGGFFFQDDWKVARRVTLNLGLRYELETPPTERFDRLLYSLDPALSLGITVPGWGPLRGGVRFVNDQGTGRRQGELDKNNFGPRVGIAVSPGKNLVLRGGYGIFFASGINNMGGVETDASFGALTPYVGSTGSDTLPIPGVSISNPFPNGYVQATGKSLGAATDLGSSVSYRNPSRVLPYVQQWQLSVQKQLRGQMLTEIAYVGAHSLKLFEDLNLNELPDKLLSNVTNVPNPFLGLLPSTSTLGQGSTVRATQLLRMYPQFNTVTQQRNNNGRVLYHSLQARVEKRLSQGVQLVANYTHSKSMQYNQYSAVNPRQWRTASSIDYPNTFNTYVTYQLPVGRGRYLGKNWGRALDTVAGGWGTAFIVHYQSGDPLTVTDTNGTPIPISNPTTSGGMHDRMGDRIDPVTRLPLNPFFSRDVWLRMPNFSISPEPPLWSWLRGPSQWVSSLTISKTVPVTERFKVDLKVQANSTFNHPIFNDPATNLASPATFGVITSTRSNACTRTITFGAKVRF
jgi:hypothetical protein